MSDLSSVMRRRFEESIRRDAEWLATRPHVIFAPGAAECFYMGRNGSASNRGLMFGKCGESVRINPMNTNGPATETAFIEIPLSELPAVIAKLQSMLPA